MADGDSETTFPKLFDFWQNYKNRNTRNTRKYPCMTKITNL